MKYSAGLVMVVSALLLSGCAGPKPNIVKAADGSSLDVRSVFASNDMNKNRNADFNLRVVSPVHTATGIGIKVLTAVLGGGIDTDGFDKEEYKGSSIDSMPESTKSYLLPKAETHISKWLAENGKGYNYEQPLFIAASRWALIYKDLSTANSDYALQYRVIFYKRPEGGNVFSTFVIADCEPTVETAPRSEWEANNYAKVTLVTQKYMDTCLLNNFAYQRSTLASPC